MIGLYDLMDQACADALGVTLEKYIERIEELPAKRAEVVIGACWEEDETLLVKARRIFHTCRTKNENDIEE
jgi:hypothetical protein